MGGLVSTTLPVRFELTGQDKIPKAERIAYLIKVPSVYDRAAYRRQVKSHGARLWLPGEVRRASRDDILAAKESGGITAADAKGALTTLDDYTACVDEAIRVARETGADPEPVPDDIADAFMGLEAAVRGMGGDYAARLADNEYFYEISMIEAVRMFVVGWENVDAQCARHGADGLTEASLGEIPDDHMRQIDGQVAELMQPSPVTEKNLPSPSHGSSGRKTSRTAKNLPKKTRRTRKKKPKAGHSRK